MFFQSVCTTTRSLLYQLAHPKPTIILGFSGGPDSLFLLHILDVLKNEGLITLVAAHLDHQWRQESAAEALFCKNYCEQKNIECIVHIADQYAQKVPHSTSKEALGRNLRRAFLTTIKNHYDAQAIALAHHRQDQLETFFVRIIRGASLSGLTCMKQHTPPYLRPLLSYNKSDILTYLEQHAIPFCSDPTNNHETFLRNRIRHNIIPACTNADARFEQKLESTIQQLQQEDAFLQQLTIKKLAELSHINHAGRSVINLLAFQNTDPVLQRRILLNLLITQQRHFLPSSATINEIIRFLMGTKGGQHCVTPWIIKKKSNIFWIE